jgi:hypothetical protein
MLIGLYAVPAHAESPIRAPETITFDSFAFIKSPDIAIAYLVNHAKGVRINAYSFSTVEIGKFLENLKLTQYADFEIVKIIGKPGCNRRYMLLDFVIKGNYITDDNSPSPETDVMLPGRGGGVISCSMPTSN